jgi:long-chain acyl-CoA synthetase
VNGIGEAARATPDAPALIQGRKVVPFAAFDERQRRLAGALRAAGLGATDRVAVVAVNRTEVVEVIVGVLRAGIVPIPVNSLLTPREIEYIIEDSGATWLFTESAVDFPSPHRVVTFGDAYERVLFEADAISLANVTLGRPMHYTSGTTGTPKGVWVAPETQDAAARRSAAFRRLWGLQNDEVHLVCSPLAHSAPLRFSIRTLESGGTVVLQSHFDAAETLAAVELFGVTSTFMVPTHLERIAALGGSIGRHDLSSVRLLSHAGAPIRTDTKRRILEVFPPGSVWEFYGATEGQATRISTEEWLRKPGSVGRALPGVEVGVLDDDGRAVAAGDPGEIWIRDPAAERFEYWGDKDKTRAAWRGDSFSVGDLGYLDRDGYLYLSGRKHDTIITGGVNVYPKEVEFVLAQHPAVAGVVVYGAPHEEWGQEVRALVVGAPGAPLDPERLRTWARERLAGFKCPRRIDVVDDLPRTPTGKVMRPKPHA